MLENFAKIGLFFETTPGDDIEEGVQGINDRLSWDPLKPKDALNCPTLFIAKSCKNTIFALERGRIPSAAKARRKTRSTISATPPSPTSARIAPRRRRFHARRIMSYHAR